MQQAIFLSTKVDTAPSQKYISSGWVRRQDRTAPAPMTELVRPYRGVSPADRTAERRQRLLEACLDVIGVAGVAGTTVGAICIRASLTKRYFYESFADLDDALAQVFDGFQQSLLVEIQQHLSALPDDPRERARDTINALMRALDDPRVARLFSEADGHLGLRALRQRAYDVYADAVATNILGLRTPNAHLTGLVLVSGITHAALAWLAGTIAIERERFVEDLVELTLGAASASSEIDAGPGAGSRRIG
jgi:AcrR family transcriptional regulator